MIIWSGFGFLVFVLSFGSCILTEFLTRTYFPEEPHYYETHGWPKLAALWFAALLVFGLSRWLAARSRKVIDNGTGLQFEMHSSHRLFFIPIQYWPYLLLLLGVVFYFVRDPS